MINLTPAYGYVRIGHGAPAEHARSLRRELISLASARGYEITEIFVESPDSAGSAYAALIEVLRAGDTKVVIVPSMHHLAQLKGVQLAMKEFLESETSAYVLAAADDLGPET